MVTAFDGLSEPPNPLSHRPAHTAKQSLNSQQLFRMQTEQPSFNQQINEYIQKLKRSSHNQRNKKFRER